MRIPDMPDIALPRPVVIAFDVACGLLVAFGLFLASLAIPAIATPVANWALGTFGPDRSTIARAKADFPGVNTFTLEEVKAPELAEAAHSRLRFNFFGFLPGLSWISRAEAQEGYVAFTSPSGGDDGLSLRRWRGLIDELAVENVTVRYPRGGQDQEVLLHKATGSLRSGALSVEATGAETDLEFEGKARRQTLSELSGTLRLKGDNFADFARLAGFAAPDTPPYDAVADVTLGPQAITLAFAPETRIGDSDLSGRMDIRFDQETPVMEADLHSANLDFDDLGIVFGIPVGVGANETVGEEQRRARDIYNASDRLIPNAVIDFSRLDAIDGHVVFQADEVSDAIFDIRALKMDVTIDGRVVRAPLLQLDFAEGRAVAYVTLDGTRSPAVTTAEGTLTDVPFASLSLSPLVRGTAEGQFRLEGRGDGFREVAANLDGRLSVWSTDAELLALAAEGAGLDLGEAMTLLGEPANDRTYTPARCAAAAIDFDQGTGAVAPAVMDTEDSLIVVGGKVQMQDETLDLSIRADAKDLSFGSLIGNVDLNGTLRHPQLNVFNGETVLQVGASALLGSLSGGLALLPFIEPGLGKDAPCGEILARVETEDTGP